MSFIPKKPDKKQSGIVGVRFREHERETIERLAKAADLSLGEFCRQAVLYAINNIGSDDA